MGAMSKETRVRQDHEMKNQEGPRDFTGRDRRPEIFENP